MKGSRFGLVTAAAVLAAFSVATAMMSAPAELKVCAAAVLAMLFGGFGAISASEE